MSDVDAIVQDMTETIDRIVEAGRMSVQSVTDPKYLAARVLFLEQLLEDIDFNILESAAESFAAKVEQTESDTAFNAMSNRVRALLDQSGLDDDSKTELLVLAAAVGQRVLEGV